MFQNRPLLSSLYGLLPLDNDSLESQSSVTEFDSNSPVQEPNETATSPDPAPSPPIPPRGAPESSLEANWTAQGYQLQLSVSQPVLSESYDTKTSSQHDPMLYAWSSTQSSDAGFHSVSSFASLSRANGHELSTTDRDRLGLASNTRANNIHQIVDVDAVINCLSRTILLTPDNDADKAALLNKPGNSYLVRFQRLGEISDVKLAIHCQNRAVLLALAGHASEPASLINLRYYLCWLHNLGGLVDITTPINYPCKALSSTLGDRVDKLYLLDNFGNFHLSWSRCLSELAPVNKMIYHQSQGVSLTLHSRKKQPRFFRKLGQSHIHHFEGQCELAEAGTTIASFQQAVRLADGHLLSKLPSVFSSAMSGPLRNHKLVWDVADYSGDEAGNYYNTPSLEFEDPLIPVAPISTNHLSIDLTSHYHTHTSQSPSWQSGDTLIDTHDIDENNCKRIPLTTIIRNMRVDVTLSNALPQCIPDQKLGFTFCTRSCHMHPGSVNYIMSDKPSTKTKSLGLALSFSHPAQPLHFKLEGGFPWIPMTPAERISVAVQSFNEHDQSAWVSVTYPPLTRHPRRGKSGIILLLALLYCTFSSCPNGFNFSFEHHGVPSSSSIPSNTHTYLEDVGSIWPAQVPDPGLILSQELGGNLGGINPSGVIGQALNEPLPGPPHSSVDGWFQQPHYLPSPPVPLDRNSWHRGYWAGFSYGHALAIATVLGLKWDIPQPQSSQDGPIEASYTAPLVCLDEPDQTTLSGFDEHGLPQYTPTLLTNLPSNDLSQPLAAVTAASLGYHMSINDVGTRPGASPQVLGARQSPEAQLYINYDSEFMDSSASLVTNGSNNTFASNYLTQTPQLCWVPMAGAESESVSGTSPDCGGTESPEHRYGTSEGTRSYRCRHEGCSKTYSTHSNMMRHFRRTHAHVNGVPSSQQVMGVISLQSSPVAGPSSYTTSGGRARNSSGASSSLGDRFIPYVARPRYSSR